MTSVTRLKAIDSLETKQQQTIQLFVPPPSSPTSMTDLTVLISPTPLHISTIKTTPFSFRRSTPCLITPVMVTLETEREEKESEFQHEEHDPTSNNVTNRGEESDMRVVEEAADMSTDSEPSQPPVKRRGRAASRIILDPNFLYPPINTFKSSSSPSARRSRHKHSRSRSAPPAPISRVLLEREEEETTTTPSTSSQPNFIPIPPSATINSFNRSLPRRSFTSLVESSGKRSNGDLLPPPPPLLRPTTFWRKTRRSGVTAASYSPSYHLIRRSTFIAAGLDLDTPSHDLRAYCVENRIGFIVVPPDCSFL